MLPPGLPCCKTQSKGFKKPIVLTATIPVGWGKQRTAAAPPQLASQGGGTVWDQTWLPGAALRAAWNLPEPAGAALGNLPEGSVKIVAQAPHLGVGFRSERLEQGSQPSRCLCCQHSGWRCASGMPSLCKGTEAHPKWGKPTELSVCWGFPLSVGYESWWTEKLNRLGGSCWVLPREMWSSALEMQSASEGGGVRPGCEPCSKDMKGKQTGVGLRLILNLYAAKTILAFV